MNKKNFELIDLISRCRRHNDFEVQEREKLLIELAAALKPFPGFLGMDSIHAIELDPDIRFPDRGCLVVTDEGLIKELSLDLIPGPTFLGGVDSKETFREVDIKVIKIINFLFLIKNLKSIERSISSLLFSKILLFIIIISQINSIKQNLEIMAFQ